MIDTELIDLKKFTKEVYLKDVGKNPGYLAERARFSYIKAILATSGFEASDFYYLEALRRLPDPSRIDLLVRFYRTLKYGPETKFGQYFCTFLYEQGIPIVKARAVSPKHRGGPNTTDLNKLGLGFDRVSQDLRLTRKDLGLFIFGEKLLAVEAQISPTMAGRIIGFAKIELLEELFKTTVDNFPNSLEV